MAEESNTNTSLSAPTSPASDSRSSSPLSLSVREGKEVVIAKPSNDDQGAVSNHSNDAVEAPPAAMELQKSSQSNNDDQHQQQHQHDDSCVRVAVRVRPLLSSEDNKEHCLSILPPNSIAVGAAAAASVARLASSNNNLPRYTFDAVYGAKTTTGTLYDVSVQPLVNACLEGYNATILAYGQTGSGKTHTILGPNYADAWTCQEDDDDDDYDIHMGVLPRALRGLFQALSERKTQKQQQKQQQQQQQQNEKNKNTWTMRLQFLELYGEEIRDLLISPNAAAATAKLTVRDGLDGEPEVQGSTWVTVKDLDEAAYVVRRGCIRRVTAATAMNATSSRSHALLTVSLEQRSRNTTTITTTMGSNDVDVVDGDEEETDTALPVTVKRSKFHFVDLAGSERQKRTQAVGKRLKEGIDINMGLLVLGNVISALGGEKPDGNKAVFVPYRDSKLTRLLRGSLGGNHKTLMIACVSPSPSNLEESLNCLRYANRAKNIQNKAVVNLDAQSKLVADLRQQVRLLAQDLLQVANDDERDEESEPRKRRRRQEYSFSIQALQEMANNGSGEKGPEPRSRLSLASGATSPTGLLSPHSSRSGFESPPTHRYDDTDNHNQKIIDLEQQLNETRAQLRRAQSYHDAAEEELHVTKAQKEAYELQCSIMSPAVSSNGDNASNFHGSEEMKRLQKVFVDKATAYEKEIGDLRRALREVENRQAQWMVQDEDESDQAAIELAEQALARDRARLIHYETSLTMTSTSETEEKVGDQDSVGATATAVALGLNTEPGLSAEATQAVDSAAAAEEALVERGKRSALKRYLEQGGLDEEDAYDESNTDPLPSPLADEAVREDRHLKADLVELTRNIAVKEGLIDQLRQSQEKYASMREFYQNKLCQMEASLLEKEKEREELVKQLETVKNTDSAKNKLKDQLRHKEQNIADLRRKQKQLRDLTAVSSRNEAEIARLQNDVLGMKRKKVDLHKQLGAERKTHKIHIRQLEMNAMQKDRELNKYKTLVQRREVQISKANQVAKGHLEEIVALRSKYRETQKNLRLKTVKRGVMAKAGLDPVLVGRRFEQLSGKKAGSSRMPSQQEEIDPDALRDVFDKKVEEVVRKEALVNQLAEEWEAHFELCSTKDDLLSSGGDASDETLQSLSIQIQYKEDHIRQLAHRLAQQRLRDETKTPSENTIKTKSFLLDEQVARLCKGAPPEQVQKTLTNVLFGMIVREKKRISALAKTASSLDEKLLQAEKNEKASEEALRSYMEEQRLEVAAMSQSQQKQILSLMEMVSDNAVDQDDSALYSESHTKLLVLANERISLLESQLQEVESKAVMATSVQGELSELSSMLDKATWRNKELNDEVLGLRSAMKRIREAFASGRSQLRESDEDAFRAVEDVLETKQPVKEEETGSEEPSEFSDRYRSGEDEYVEEANSEGEEPGWAASIIEELAYIAEGKIPPSLANSAEFARELSLFELSQVDNEKNSVFDRLTDPNNFTGIQKQARFQAKKDRQSPKTPNPNNGKAKMNQRLATDSRHRAAGDELESSDAVDTARGPIVGEYLQDSGEPSSSTNTKERKSVFDRLVSPSQATGVHKQRFAQRSKSTGEVADRRQDEHVSGKHEPYEKSSKKKPIALAPRSLDTEPTEDVFERLNRTTTMSYSNKHQGIVLHEPANEANRVNGLTSSSAEDLLDDLLNDELQKSHSTLEATLPPHLDITTDYTRQDVFERLQRTTTEAYAKKVNKAK